MRYRLCRLSQVVAAISVCLLGWHGVAAAQSLAEVAKLEESRRKAVKKPATVYTNGSLKPVPGDVIPTPPPPRTGDQPPAVVGVPDPAVEAAPAPDSRKTPEYWKKRMTDAVQQRDNNALMLDALQSRIDGLWADFTARDNPVERAQIASNRQKALDELERRKKEQVALGKAITDLEDEARRAGVPPGWLR